MNSFYITKVDHFTLKVHKETGDVYSVSKNGRHTQIHNPTTKQKAYGKMIMDLNLGFKHFNNHHYGFLFGSAFNLVTGKTVTDPNIIKLFKEE